MKAARRAVIVLAALTVCGLGAAQIAPIEELDAFPHSKLSIRSGKSVHDFEVWIADTPARQAQGLMFVRELASDRGMLFVYPEARRLGMWMKNTYIELDMLFLAPDGRIVHLVERARPHSLDTIASPQPAKAVLELRGGEVSRRALKVGDRVLHESLRSH